MILAELTQQIAASVAGGKNKNEGAINYEWIESMMPKWRQRAILIAYNGSQEVAGNKMIPSDWLQSFTLTIPQSERNKEKIFLQIPCPTVLRVNHEGTGSVFVGDREEGYSFTEISSPSYAADLVRRGDLNKQTIGYVYSGSNIRFYGNGQLERADFDVILNNPLDAPNFDIDNDPYPVSQDVIEIMERLAFIELNPQLARPEDLINDGSDTLDRRANKANVV